MSSVESRIGKIAIPSDPEAHSYISQPGVCVVVECHFSRFPHPTKVKFLTLLGVEQDLKMETTFVTVHGWWPQWF